MENQDLKNLIQQEIKNYMNSSQYGISKIPSHLHNGIDTPKITVVDVPIETPISLGLGALISTSKSYRHLCSKDSTSEQVQTSMNSGTDQTGTVGVETKNLQFNLLHQPNNLNNQSFITAVRPPVFSTPSGTTVSTTAAGNTVTVSGNGFPNYLTYTSETGNFTVGLTVTGGTSGATGVISTITDDGTSGTISFSTVTGEFTVGELITDTSTGSANVATSNVNILTGALINIYNAAGSLVETQTIASNTGTVITIAGTWLATTALGSFFIFQPVFMGSADTPYQRFYTEEGTGAGIRFGVGTTNGGQNGLLWMNSVGNLFWRPKTAAAFTAVAATDIITVTGQNFIIQDGVKVQFSTTNTLPAGLSTGTTYYLISSVGATFQVSTTFGGAAVNITNTGTGTHTVSSVGLY